MRAPLSSAPCPCLCCGRMVVHVADCIWAADPSDLDGECLANVCVCVCVRCGACCRCSDAARCPCSCLQMRRHPCTHNAWVVLSTCACPRQLCSLSLSLSLSPHTHTQTRWDKSGPCSCFSPLFPFHPATHPPPLPSTLPPSPPLHPPKSYTLSPVPLNPKPYTLSPIPLYPKP